MEKEKIKTQAEIANFYPVLTAIWREVFDPIIGSDQVEYMLANYQSKEIIAREIAQGVNYYMLKLNHEVIGYIAYEIRQEDLYLSKIYISSKYRGQGYMREIFAYFDDLSKQLHLKQHLRVNQGNKRAISVYKHMGFQMAGEQITDIGSGYQMVDYVFEKP